MRKKIKIDSESTSNVAGKPGMTLKKILLQILGDGGHDKIESMPGQKITACAFIHHQGKLFVAKRALTKKYKPGVFELPGGHIEYGEEIIEGLKREIKDELHLKIKVGDPFYAVTYIDKTNNHHYVEVVYFAQFQPPFPEIKLNPEDHSEYKWITTEEAELTFGKDNYELKAAQRGFEILQKV